MAKHALHTDVDSQGNQDDSVTSNFSSINYDLVRVRKKRKKRGKILKIVLIVLAVILAICVGLGIAVASYVKSLNDSISLDEEDAAELTAVLSETTAEEPFYMLLLGSDAREEDATSRSDTIILVRVDATLGQVTLVSIPRDTKVEIEGYGTQKINAAYAYGGAAGAVEAVEDLAGIEISHYAEIHFEEFEELVDSLGGIWVDIPVSNDQTGYSNTGVELNAGTQKLTGEEALAFARERYGYNEGDFQRTENQRILVQALADTILSLSATELPSAIQSLASCVSTDFDISDLIELAQTFQSAEDYCFYSAMVPSTTQTIDGVSYTITLEDEWEEMMELVDSGQDPSSATVLTQDTQAVEEEE